MKKIATFFLTSLTLLASFQQSFASDGDSKLKNQLTAKSENFCSATPLSNFSFQTNVFQNASGRVSLILLKSDKEPVSINIYDDDNRLVFNEKIWEDSVKQNFIMNELEPGNYRFTVSRNGECFTKTVTVK